MVSVADLIDVHGIDVVVDTVCRAYCSSYKTEVTTTYKPFVLEAVKMECVLVNRGTYIIALKGINEKASTYMLTDRLVTNTE